MALGIFSNIAHGIYLREEEEGLKPISEANTSIRIQRLGEARERLERDPADEWALGIVAKAEARPDLFRLPVPGDDGGEIRVTRSRRSAPQR